ncbi:MAG: hypothetical protein ACJ77D_10110 [Chloroflexota bacterium]|jgi:hypothetical protein
MTRHRWLITGLAVLAVALGACNSATSAAPKVEAITMEEDEASGLKTLTLSEKAAQRLGVETAEVGAAASGTSIPYAAIVYDAQGKTWTYVTEQPLVFKRAEITVDDIAGDTARLSAGPPAGTQVVTTGAAELYGAEIGVGGGH